MRHTDSSPPVPAHHVARNNAAASASAAGDANAAVHRSLTATEAEGHLATVEGHARDAERHFTTTRDHTNALGPGHAEHREATTIQGEAAEHALTANNHVVAAKARVAELKAAEAEIPTLEAKQAAHTQEVGALEREHATFAAKLGTAPAHGEPVLLKQAQTDHKASIERLEQVLPAPPRHDTENSIQHRDTLSKHVSDVETHLAHTQQLHESAQQKFRLHEKSQLGLQAAHTAVGEAAGAEAAARAAHGDALRATDYRTAQLHATEARTQAGKAQTSSEAANTAHAEIHADATDVRQITQGHVDQAAAHSAEAHRLASEAEAHAVDLGKPAAEKFLDAFRKKQQRKLIKPAVIAAKEERAAVTGPRATDKNRIEALRAAGRDLHDVETHRARYNASLKSESETRAEMLTTRSQSELEGLKQNHEFSISNARMHGQQLENALKKHEEELAAGAAPRAPAAGAGPVTAAAAARHTSSGPEAPPPLQLAKRRSLGLEKPKFT